MQSVASVADLCPQRLWHDSAVRILVVEDDRSIADFVASGLRQEGFAVDVARDGVDGLERCRAHPYDAAIVDVMLPRLDGLSLVSALRRASVETPVLFLSARHSVDDRVKGLQTGGTTTSPSRLRLPSCWHACRR